jgi:ribonuclease HII
VAAAVILRADRYIRGVADSKVLTPAEREAAFGRVCAAALAFEVAVVSPGEIDRLNILRASFVAMRQAVLGLSPLPDFVIADGHMVIPELPMAQRAVIGGDRKSTAVAAASILAKVTRDRLMCELHLRDPRYGFDRHKGYATAEHLDAVNRYGYSVEHRRTFRQPTLFDTIRD